MRCVAAERHSQRRHALAGDAGEQVLGDAAAKHHRPALRLEGVGHLGAHQPGRVARERPGPVAALLQRQLSSVVHGAILHNSSGARGVEA
jgi:hypothetical protein